jgi:hypothetical protein
MVTGEKAMVAWVFLKKGAEALEPWCAVERNARATSFQAAQACLLTERPSTGAKQP